MVGGEKLAQSMYELVYQSAGGQVKGAERCARIAFRIPDDPELSGKAELRLARLTTSAPDNPDCDVEVQRKLDQLAPGLVIRNCRHEDNSFRFDLERPTGISDEQISQALHYAFIETLEGPFVFSVDLP